MSFFKIRQITLTGERKTFINLSAVAYIQELTPDQDPGWQVGVEPSRALIFFASKNRSHHFHQQFRGHRQANEGPGLGRWLDHFDIVQK